MSAVAAVSGVQSEERGMLLFPFSVYYLGQLYGYGMEWKASVFCHSLTPFHSNCCMVATLHMIVLLEA